MAKNRRVNVKAILADPDLRRKLMVSTIQATQAREGIDTTEEQADRAYYVVTEAERATFFELDRFKGAKRGEQDTRHEMFVKTLRAETDGVRYDIARRDFAAIDGRPLAYERVGIVAPIFRESLPATGPHYRQLPRQGISLLLPIHRFVRCLVGNSCRCSRARPRLGSPFAKGGAVQPVLCEQVFLVVDWRDHERRADP